jgi:hypothetical protein
MNDRELATFLLLGSFLVLVTVSKTGRGALLQLGKSLASPVGVYLLSFALWIAAAVWLEAWLGLWTRDLIAGTLLWFLFIGFVWFLHIGGAGHDPDFIKRHVLEAIGIAALFEFFLNVEVLPLGYELALQVFLLVVVMIDALARTDNKYRAVTRLTGSVLVLTTFGLAIYTIRQLVAHWHQLDLLGLVDQLVLPVWLTIAAIPYLYLLALYAGYQSLILQMSFRNNNQKPALAAIMGVMTGLRGSLVDIEQFSRRSHEAARTNSYRTARRSVADFKARRASDIAARNDANDRLAEYAGVLGVDTDGLTLDRREFSETKEALRLLATRHMGWYRRDNQNHYQADLMDRVPDYTGEGLPDQHGIQLQVRPDGQAWYAYRVTPSGYMFGIGAAGPPPDQWQYDGTGRPDDYPAANRSGWTSLLQPDRPEWKLEDPT